jgi:hypothetical protein
MHHGYQWLDKNDHILKGIVKAFYFGNPHITMHVQSGGVLWLVESTDVLGAQLVGFDGNSVKVGDTVTIYGYRSKDPLLPMMRGDKIEVSGRVYVLLPKRIFGPPFGGAPL